MYIRGCRNSATSALRGVAAGFGWTRDVRIAARHTDPWTTQPALSRLEAGGVVPTIPLLERISIALDAELIIEIGPHAA
jgi:hypothetical protein